MSSRPRRSKPKLDRISALPDSLLCHILSFLPTKLAVTTSVLSKRWTPLWRSVLTLDVDEDDFKDFRSFRHFLYSVIILRDAGLPIRSFRINCGNSNDFDPLDVNLFVHAAVQRGLEIFDLDMVHAEIDDDDLQKVAPSVLICRTLVVLKLKNLTIYEIPQLVDLPLLKTLHLDSINFLGYFVDVMNLFNGCPVLEDLHTNYLDLDDWDDSNEDFKFKGFPNLVRANFAYLLKFQFAWFYNAKFMRVGVKLSLIYEDPIPTFHNLTHMELIFSSDYSWPGWVIQLLQHCPKLQNLIIVQGDYTIEPEIELEDWKDPETVPECLSSQLRTCSLRDYTSNQCNLHFAEYVMLNSKLLCTMTIKSGYGVDEKAKHQMLKILSSYPRGSVTCKLLFDW